MKLFVIICSILITICQGGTWKWWHDESPASSRKATNVMHYYKYYTAPDSDTLVTKWQDIHISVARLPNDKMDLDTWKVGGKPGVNIHSSADNDPDGGRNAKKLNNCKGHYGWLRDGPSWDDATWNDGTHQCEADSAALLKAAYESFSAEKGDTLFSTEFYGLTRRGKKRRNGPAAPRDQSCINAPGIPEDRRTDKDRLTIVQYNVEWLSDAECEEGSQPDHYKENHLQTIANTLSHMNPDIIVMEEICDCTTIKHLADAMYAGKGTGKDKKKTLFKAYSTYSNRAGGQNVGILTKIDPIQDVQLILDDVEGNQLYKNIYAKFNIDHVGILHLFGIHLKAGSSGGDISKKQVEAGSIATKINAIKGDGGQIIVTGDFNDFDELNTKSGMERDKDDHHPKSTAAQQLRDAGDLINIGLIRPRGTDRFTHNHGMIDHMLVTNGIKTRISKFLIYHPMSYNDPKNPKQMQPEDFGSDHWPIELRILTKPRVRRRDTLIYPNEHNLLIATILFEYGVVSLILFCMGFVFCAIFGYVVSSWMSFKKL